MEMISVPQSSEPKLYLVAKEGHESYLKGFLKEVPMARASLTPEDVFVLDSGRKIYIWAGQNASELQKINAGLYANSVEAKRGGDPAILTYDVDEAFWALLDSNLSTCQTEINESLIDGPKLTSFDMFEPELKPVLTGENSLDNLPDEPDLKPVLYIVSKEGRESYLKGFLKEVPISRASLNQEDVLVLDTGRKIHIWAGRNASELQKINAGLYAKSVEAKRSGDLKLEEASCMQSPAVPASCVQSPASAVDVAFWALLDDHFARYQRELWSRTALH
jgi:hypothetical protein